VGSALSGWPTTAPGTDECFGVARLHLRDKHFEDGIAFDPHAAIIATTMAVSVVAVNRLE
jgi:hypothetical protein